MPRGKHGRLSDEHGPSPALPTRVSQEMLDALKQAAALDERSFNDYVRLVLRRHLERRGLLARREPVTSN